MKKTLFLWVFGLFLNFSFPIAQSEHVLKSAQLNEATVALFFEQAIIDSTNLVFIKGGTFVMGSPTSEVGRAKANVETLHTVTVDDFYMGKYEVTIGEYEAYCKETGAKKPPYLNYDETQKQYPVVNVTQYEARMYCNWLSKKTKKKYRLPTEAEWEYACRAGTKTTFSIGDNITTDQANFNGAYPYNGSPKSIDRKKTTPVGSFAPNAWGLYDMHGNVQEWCLDVFNPDFYITEDATKPNPIHNKYTRGYIIRGEIGRAHV